MRFTKKLKAGALQYTIFVSVLILLLVTTFISLAYLQQKTRIKASFFQEAVNNASKSFDYLKTHQIPYYADFNISFNNEIDNNTILSKKPWGIFDVVTSKTSVKNEYFQKMAFTGGYSTQREALFLNDNNKPLVLVGNTKIQGNVALPKKGVKRGNIAGNSYYGSQLIYGNIRLSNTSLPQLNNETYLKPYFNDSFINNEFEFFELKDNLKKVVSFDEQTELVKNFGQINLQFIELTGNIIIQSSTKIKVSISALLTDVILIAPIIEIENSVKGNFQALATKQILVGENCELNYPTSLIINEESISSSNQQNKVTDKINQIVVNENTTIKGIVAFLTNTKQTNYKPQILLEKNAIVSGEVYCEKNFELKGTVNGMIYTDSFVATQFGSVYINHIFNGTIIESNLPKQYSGLQLPSTKNKVVKWVY
jgi:cytoskeletal protein CcmA (bactofilin family)